MIEWIRATCPFPTIDRNGSVRGGYNLPANPKCLKCQDKSCLQMHFEAQQILVQHSVCKGKLSYFSLKLPKGRIIVCGLIEPEFNKTCPPLLKKSLKQWKVPWQDISTWHATMVQLIQDFEDQCQKCLSDSVAGLHDVKTALSLILRNTEALIGTRKGESAEERLDNCEEPLKSLYKSVQLLQTRLQASGYAANPEAITLGRKRAHAVYRQVDRIGRMFNEIAAKKKVVITMGGHSQKTPFLFDSFDVIPLILIDNAVKYSFQGENVNIRVDDLGECVSVAVESRGPLVPIESQELIFNRGYRTEAAKRISSDGSGLGLYIASLVAKAHGFEILYHSQPVAGWQPGRGLNIFSFTITSS
ncbi:MAG: ATP-binding protein [Candidatus Hydrogenedentes bacterium]|nr:ATP-binding protein [Candidatus Hydrogenedentota bacterium]